MGCAATTCGVTKLRARATTSAAPNVIALWNMIPPPPTGGRLLPKLSPLSGSQTPSISTRAHRGGSVRNQELPSPLGGEGLRGEGASIVLSVSPSRQPSPPRSEGLLECLSLHRLRQFTEQFRGLGVLVGMLPQGLGDVAAHLRRQLLV